MLRRAGEGLYWSEMHLESLGALGEVGGGDGEGRDGKGRRGTAQSRRLWWLE